MQIACPLVGLALGVMRTPFASGVAVLPDAASPGSLPHDAKARHASEAATTRIMVMRRVLSAWRSYG